MQENERLAAQIAAMRDEPSPLEAARGKRDEHLADRAKFQKLIESLQVCWAFRSLAGKALLSTKAPTRRLLSTPRETRCWRQRSVMPDPRFGHLIWGMV